MPLDCACGTRTVTIDTTAAIRLCRVACVVIAGEPAIDDLSSRGASIIPESDENESRASGDQLAVSVDILCARIFDKLSRGEVHQLVYLF